MPLYRKKPETPVHAVKVTDATYNGLEFSKPPFSEMPPWLQEAINATSICHDRLGKTNNIAWLVHSGFKQMRAGSGDYIIFHGNDDSKKDEKFEVVSEEGLKATYEPVED